VIREILAYATLTACGAGLLYIFVSIAVEGGYLAIEDNTGILYSEVVLSGGIFLFGVERLMSFLKRK
jgi:hypothetical protein